VFNRAVHKVITGLKVLIQTGTLELPPTLVFLCREEDESLCHGGVVPLIYGGSQAFCLVGDTASWIKQCLVGDTASWIKQCLVGDTASWIKQ
jgi:hypothetical protein